ncbi:hypothetical protein H5410_060581 [Solanum commersonii]|uniref:Uncharacterized protein n=1 Tax=Solanum commersonii TaxID=4109 RepID=A0A9J5W623_SOLCO|nr:hypothetical protein H5410_060581 [Solanum commersonii]
MDRIMDINFYDYFVNKFKTISDETTPTETIFWLHGLDRAKRIIVVMNIEKKYVVNLEILLNDRVINVYDYNIHVFKHCEFLTFIQPVFELLTILLR